MTSGVGIYPQEAETLGHVDIDGGSVAAQAAPVRVVVVVVGVYAVLAGTEPLVVRPVRVASIKCHFHSGDFFASATRLRSHTDNGSFTFNPSTN